MYDTGGEEVEGEVVAFVVLGLDGEVGEVNGVDALFSGLGGGEQLQPGFVRTGL